MENKNIRRNETRKLSKVAPRVYRSLQNCSLSLNRNLLVERIDRTNPNSSHHKHLLVLLHILDRLSADVYDDCVCKVILSHMEFKDAIEIFLAFTGKYKTRSICDQKELKTQLTDLLLNEAFGLRVFIVKISEK